ncbi:MAG: GMC family oxidoreductase N-terminal domain-containing protein, partial [Burkholderiales bacterium]|nr:GMC family oxidoreductase N-terminal domain-containing protein [Burkholderiales bacterium]
MTDTTAPLNVQGLVDLWQPAGQPGRHFDVLIVGSGYGGSVAAALLAGQTHPATGHECRIGLLERGKAYQPGEFPSQFGQLPAHTRLANGNHGTVGGKADGLFDVHTGNDVVALVANGVGGGSLINAGVLLEPALEDFADDTQLQQLIAELKTGQYYEQALRALGGRVDRNGTSMLNTVAAFPGWDLPKTQALASLRGPHRFDCPPLSVSLDGQANAAGVSLSACNRCGDCLTGCNQGAKDSLDTNLLALASRHKGFQIYTGASVLSVNRQPGAAVWTVSVVHTHPTLQSRETGPLELTADRVILAAGALGSTDILLRSRNKGMALSPRLGERFSCNGDNIAAVYKLPVRAHAIADEDTPADQRHVGPTITGSISMPGTTANQGKRGFKLQEFSVPGALKHVAEELITTAALIQSLTSPDSSQHLPATHEPNDPLAVSPDAMDRSLVVGIIGHDDAQGALHLPPASTRTEAQPVPGVVNIHWPQARQSADLLHAADSLAELVGQQNTPAPAESDRPTVVPNPLWNVLPKGLKDLVSQPYGPVLTVHPLGGCSMGRDAADGVVDTEGRVYLTDPAQSSWFGSLVVLDGAILRGSLGVNPALTIAATAWRAMSRLVPQWTGRPASLPPAFGQARRQMLLRHTPSAPPPPTQPTEIEIVERLDGPVSLHIGHTLPQACVLELTLAYEPFHIRPWLQQFGRTLHINTQNGLSSLRIYRATDWHTHQLRVQTNAKRHAHAIFEADVSGTLTVLNREPSGSGTRGWRALSAWWVNRGLRDFAQQFFTDLDGLLRRLKNEGSSFWSIATRAGEVRLFEYELTIGTIHKRLRNDSGQTIDPLPVGSTISGHKRITYNRRANPWHQLTELTLTRMPALAACSPRKLTLDPRFLAEQDLPLLRITRQHSLTRAWQDLASLGLLFTRVILNTHLWTFRKPDAPLDREPRRLPDTIAGLAAPLVTELVVADTPRVGPVKIRLTHYRPTPAAQAKASGPSSTQGLAPLVMIHGYSVSGNTFTHPSLQPSAAEFFCRQGREVWVVDLRTSTGLPTATHPWSMEEVALVDIPAALTHIRQVSQQPVDVLAHCIGCVMLSMAMLTTARDLRSGSVRLGTDALLTDAQLATLDAFNGRLPDDTGPHPCIRKVILSQKGPVLRYTDSNVFRGYLMQSIRRWVLNDGYQFRRSATPGLAEELTDRLLASVPYPDEEYDTENPFWPPGKTVPWVGSRHRMDALYGRDFSVNQLSEATRDAIDDLFGPINMDTVAQTIHFTRLSTITNQNGRGEFVTPERLHTHWRDVPTLAIHGQENGLVDVSTQDLLTANMRKAGVPFRAQPSDQPPYNQLGHQDVLIGTSSAQVFADMEAFLQEDSATPAPHVPDPPQPPPFELALPWLGPRLHANDWSDPNSLHIACMGHPAQGSACLMLVPVEVDGLTLRCSQAGVLLSGMPQVAESDEWLTVPAPAIAGSSATGHLAVLVY